MTLCTCSEALAFCEAFAYALCGETLTRPPPRQHARLPQLGPAELSRTHSLQPAVQALPAPSLTHI